MLKTISLKRCNARVKLSSSTSKNLYQQRKQFRYCYESLLLKTYNGAWPND